MKNNTIKGDLIPNSEDQVPESLVLQIIRVADLLARVGDAKVFGKTLTQPQFNVLMILKRHGQDGLSQKEIAGYLVWTKGNVSIHISNLTRKGYIHRKVSKTDARANVITLTAKGRRILEDLEPKYMEQIQKLAETLSHTQARATINLLSKLSRRCEELLGDKNEYQ